MGGFIFLIFFMASSNLLAVRGKEDISTIRLPYS